MAMKKGLGKGLDALIPAGETNSKNGKETPIDSPDKMVNISKVEPNPDQPRKSFAEDELEELADSIKKIGIFQPILVQDKGDHYMIVAGERRWRAALKAGLKEVPVIIKNYTEERVYCIAMNTKNEIIGFSQVAQGSVNTCYLDTKELFKTILLCNANKFILAHNHPSGDSTPSLNDYQMTERIKEASKIMGIDFLDHIVVAQNGYTSCYSIK